MLLSRKSLPSTRTRVRLIPWWRYWFDCVSNLKREIMMHIVILLTDFKRHAGARPARWDQAGTIYGEKKIDLFILFIFHFNPNSNPQFRSWSKRSKWCSREAKSWKRLRYGTHEPIWKHMNPSIISPLYESNKRYFCRTLPCDIWSRKKAMIFPRSPRCLSSRPRSSTRAAWSANEHLSSPAITFGFVHFSSFPFHVRFFCACVFVFFLVFYDDLIVV